MKLRSAMVSNPKFFMQVRINRLFQLILCWIVM